MSAMERGTRMPQSEDVAPPSSSGGGVWLCACPCSGQGKPSKTCTTFGLRVHVYTIQHYINRRKLTSFCTVSLTLRRLLCGSVQTNPASINRTLLSPLSFLRQMASSSLLSNCAGTQEDGGER